LLIVDTQTFGYTMLKKAFFSFLISLACLSNAFATDGAAELNKLLQQYKGNVVYVDFWASWCGPCRKSFPWMNNMKNKYSELKVISINVDANKSLATEFLQKVPANFPVIYDPKGVTAKKYKLKGMPSSYIFNKKGQLVSAHVGFTDTKQKKYELELQTLLAE